MNISHKLKTLIRRKGVSKTEFAAMAGITYRALANYISGDRKPRRSILAKMAELLNCTPEFLLDDSQCLILTSTERFAFRADSPESAVNAALALLDDARKLFSHENPESNLTTADRQALFSCITDIYFDA